MLNYCTYLDEEGKNSVKGEITIRTTPQLFSIHATIINGK